MLDQDLDCLTVGFWPVCLQPVMEVIEVAFLICLCCLILQLWLALLGNITDYFLDIGEPLELDLSLPGSQLIILLLSDNSRQSIHLELLDSILQPERLQLLTSQQKSLDGLQNCDSAIFESVVN